MSTASFHFTSHKNSFHVHVSNLESLSVDMIQNIQTFVKQRNGIFDFNTYTFVIHKRLEFSEFVKLIKESSIEAVCFDNPLKSTLKPKVEFGQYKGMYYSDLPDSYLVWLKGNYSGKDRDAIVTELKIRNL